MGFALPTGLGELRNGLVVRAADAVVAVGGAHGTLSEIALALTRASGRRLRHLADRGYRACRHPAAAVERALELAADAEAA